VSAVRPFVEGSVAGVESGLPLSIVASTSEDFIAIDDGDGFAQMLAPGFSVPFAEFFGFLPAGSKQGLGGFLLLVAYEPCGYV
jgi:hypothetical protein